LSDIAIVGAGIGGLCAARAVALAGHRPLLIERNRDTAIGAALGLWPNAVHALDRLDYGYAVRGAGMTATCLLIRSADGALLARTDVEAVGRAAGAPLLLVERPDLHRLLAEGLDPAHHGTVTSVDDGGVTLADGDRIAAAAVIGADGISSVVRRQVAPDSEVVEAGYTAVRGLADCPLADGLACEAWGQDELVGATALRSGRAYWFFEAPTARFDGVDPLAAVTPARWPEPWPAIVAATNSENVLVHPIRTVRPLRSWHRGRVAVLGDAAHAMEPNLGQGAAQAIEDAAVLLTALRTHRDLPQALSAYEARRRPRATMIQRESARMARLALNRHARARNLLIRATPQRVRSLMINRLLTD
jgi:2-polyprenyl-6-methoxyphenol hydroxylase-like FAD-dependent oxidoreductase